MNHSDTLLIPRPIEDRSIWHAFIPRTDTEDALYWGNKACRKCRQFKSLDDFHQNNDHKGRFIANRVSHCKTCRSQRYKEGG